MKQLYQVVSDESCRVKGQQSGGIIRKPSPMSWKVLPAFALLGLCAACARIQQTPDTSLTILTGGTGGSFYPLGEELARIYNRAVPHMRATAKSTVASVFNVLAIQEGKADVAFTQGDVAYLAYSRGTESWGFPHNRLRGIAVLWVNTVQLVVRRDSDIHKVSDLYGRRVGVGPKASGTEISSRTVIEGHRMKYGDVIPEFVSFSEVVSRMEARTLDAGFVVASYPVAAVSEMNSSFGIRLISISRDTANHIRTQYPFMRPVTIPGNTYAGQTDDIETVGIDNMLIDRDDLPGQLVYRLTKAFFDSLPSLAQVDLGAALIDPEQGATTPIPLHPGAARFYREREILR